MIRIFVLAIALVFAFVSPVAASVSLEPTEVEAGQTVDVRVLVTAESQPTTRVELVFSDPSVEQADAAFVDGWSATLDRDSNDQLSSITWDKGEIAAGESQTFVVTLTIPANSDRIAMTALQASADGTIARIPESGQTFGLTVSGATAVTTTSSVTSTTTAAELEPETESRSSGIGFYLIAFGVVVVLALYVRTKRRVARGMRDRD